MGRHREKPTGGFIEVKKAGFVLLCDALVVTPPPPPLVLQRCKVMLLRGLRSAPSWDGSSGWGFAPDDEREGGVESGEGITSTTELLGLMASPLLAAQITEADNICVRGKFL